MIESTLQFDDVEVIPGLLPLLQAVQRSRVQSRKWSGRRPGNKACPCCDGEHNNLPESFQIPPDVVQSILGSLPVQCDQPDCTAYLALKDLLTHIEQGCRPSDTAHNQSVKF